ncbi:hypothetical protein MIZ01_0215 [Sideroxyarcus emersonii]|uniref:Uncharacterized protein n=1 Tax=Sideroxyarcus emersonii TaxID=2764705 RepID=A0AAN1X8A3_9PROT|nr:hypothetical protein MIZ01_0215 [Sideroxyarcus emersonii]
MHSKDKTNCMLKKALDSGLRRIPSDLLACELSRMARCSINDVAG